MNIRRHISAFTLATLLLFLGQQAMANTLTLDHEELKGIFTDIQIKDSPWPAEDLVISNFSSSPSTVTLPVGNLAFELINQQHDRYLGQKSISVLIKVDGTPKAKVKMRGTLELYGDVILLSRRLGRKDVISRDDLRVVRRNITTFGHELVTSADEAIGQELKTSLTAGTVLLAKYLKKLPLVKRGDLVTITATTKSLQITTKGEARSQGVKGDTIQVKNLGSRQLITAQVVGPGRVQVVF